MTCGSFTRINLFLSNRQFLTSVVILLHLFCCLLGASIVYCTSLVRSSLSSLDIDLNVYDNSFDSFSMFVGVATMVTHFGGIQVNTVIDTVSSSWTSIGVMTQEIWHTIVSLLCVGVYSLKVWPACTEQVYSHAYGQLRVVLAYNCWLNPGYRVKYTSCYEVYSI